MAETSTSDNLQSDPGLAFRARRLSWASTLHNRAAAERAGLHPTDWTCLDTLEWMGPSPQRSLAAALRVTPAAVSGVVDRLEAAGCVRRQADPGDRRRTIVALARGEKLASLEPNFRQLEADLEQLAADLSDDQRRLIADYLDGVADALERSADRFRSADGDPSATQR